MSKNKIQLDKPFQKSLTTPKIPSSEYTLIYEGQVTNAVTAVNSKSHHIVDADKQTWLFPIEELGGGVNGIVSIDIPEKNKLTLSSSKLLDTITISLTDILPYKASDEKLAPFLDFDLDVYKYMTMCGLQDKNQTVKQLKKDLETLFNARVTTILQRKIKKGKTFKTITEPIDMRFIDEKTHGQIRDYAHIHIALSYARYLTQSQIMSYPLKILVTAKNPNVYYLGKRLATLFNMNKGKKNEDTIGMNNLLKYTPNIPTLEEERKKGRHYRERCKEPLEKALDELEVIGILSEWYFMNEKKEKITDEDLFKWTLTYEDCQKTYIYFVLKDHPKQLNDKKK